MQKSYVAVWAPPGVPPISLSFPGPEGCRGLNPVPTRWTRNGQIAIVTDWQPLTPTQDDLMTVN